jgi:acyl-CoA thioesterase
MSDPDGDTDLAAKVAAGMYALDTAARGLGIVIEEVRQGHARMTMTVRDDMLNSHGTCHGGFLFALADTAFAYACNSHNRATVAASCSITFLKPAQAGAVLTAICERQALNGRSGVYDTRILDETGAVVALFRGNSREIRGPSAPEII